MAFKYRPGSMGAADAKVEKRIIIGITIALTVCLALWAIPSNLYSHYYFKNAGTLAKVLGFISAGGMYYFTWKWMADYEGKALYLLVWLALTLALLSGFNFDLPK